MTHPIAIKWLYAPRTEKDGTRILIDRLWPYGRDQDELGVHFWWPNAAPSSALKRQYTKGDIDWKEFVRCYRNELYTRPEKLRALRDTAAKGPVTLLTLERELDQSAALLLKESLALWPELNNITSVDVPVPAVESAPRQGASG